MECVEPAACAPVEERGRLADASPPAPGLSQSCRLVPGDVSDSIDYRILEIN